MNVKSNEARNASRARGFSLIEMIVSLAIIALLAGFFVMRFGDSVDEQTLQPIANDLKKMARQAISEAAAYREDYVIRLLPSEVVLVRGFGVGSIGTDAPVVSNTISVPDSALLEVRWPGQDNWQTLEAQAWLFRSGGLCEPISLRLSSRSSAAFVELVFDPLTAQADEQSYFP